MSPPPAVWLVAPPGMTFPDAVGPLADAGFAISRYGDSNHTNPVAIVIFADTLEEPVAFTHKFRAAEPGVPVLWMLSKDAVSDAALGLEAGADACLLRPANGPLLVAQLRALIRARTVTATADELRDLTGRLQRLYDQTEQDSKLASRLAGLRPNTVADCARWRVGVTGGDGFDEMLLAGVRALNLIDVAGLGTVGGALVACAISRALARSVTERDLGCFLTSLNRDIRGIGLPESAVVSATVGLIDSTSDVVRVAVAGFPAPVLVKPDAPAEVWMGSGLFLGTADTRYTPMSAELAPGEKLILFGRGTAELRPDVREIADANRQLAAQPLADAITAGIGSDEAFTLLVVERRES